MAVQTADSMAAQAAHSVVAVIPTLAGNVARLNRAIRSVRKFTKKTPVRIVVVNNSSNPIIRGLSPVDEVLFPGLNVGYVGALELVRRTCSAEFMWVIQDDMELSNDVLEPLMNTLLERRNVAVASPVLVRHGVVPAGTRAGVFTNLTRTKWKNFPFVDTRPDEIDSSVPFSFVAGSGALYRVSSLRKVGGFNLDLYPLLYVDNDICAKFLANGFDITLVPQAHIEHEVQGSTPRTLGRVLDVTNRAIVEQALASRQTVPPGTNSASPNANVNVDHDLLAQIARKASYLILELARHSDKKIADLQHEVDIRAAEINLRGEKIDLLHSRLTELTLQLEQTRGSWSWRLTRPLRGMRNQLRRGTLRWNK